MISIRDFDWDEALLDYTRRDAQARVSVYRPPDTVVVLGRGSKPELEVETEAVRGDEVALLRRRGGGCSVVLDPGNVIASVVLPLPGFGGIPQAFSKISEWVVSALDMAGAPNVCRAGVSDLVIGKRKVGGACIYRTRGILYYSTTLLFQPDLGLVERYLKHPPREPAYREGRTHRAFMGSIAELANLTDIESFAASIKKTLINSLTDLELSFEACGISPKSTAEVIA